MSFASNIKQSKQEIWIRQQIRLNMDNIHPLIDVLLAPLNCSSSIHVRLKTTSSSCHHSCLKWQTRVTQDVVYSQTNPSLNDRPTFGQHPINHLPPCSARGETDTSSSLLEPLWDGRKKEISHSWIRVCRVTIDLDAAQTCKQCLTMFRMESIKTWNTSLEKMSVKDIC